MSTFARLQRLAEAS